VGVLTVGHGNQEKANKAAADSLLETVGDDEAPPIQEDNEEARALATELEMMASMGLPGIFDTTQGKPMLDTDPSCANISKKRAYRQYMNRRGIHPPPPHAIKRAHGRIVALSILFTPACVHAHGRMGGSEHPRSCVVLGGFNRPLDSLK
jgi:hypothetical protein